MRQPVARIQIARKQKRAMSISGFWNREKKETKKRVEKRHEQKNPKLKIEAIGSFI